MGRYLDYPSSVGAIVPNATASEDGFMSSEDKAKLDSIPPGGGGGGDDATQLHFAYIVDSSGIIPGSVVCPGAQVGDVVVEVLWAVDASSGTSSNQVAANFESVITIAGHIQRTGDGGITGQSLLVVLKRS